MNQPHPVMAYLKRERIRRGLSQERAARRARLARSTLTHWEAGDHEPTLTALVIYLTSLGLKLEVGPATKPAREPADAATPEGRAA